MVPHIETYHLFNQLELKATYYPQDTKSVKQPLIIYLHGGGLIYGNRDDLPSIYMSQFNQAGYPVLTLDYPFIPEVRLRDILSVLKVGIQWALDHPIIDTDNYILFGRSAGSYLSLLLASDPTLPNPTLLISFYGYYSLADQALQQPSLYYKKYPAIPFMVLHQLIEKSPLASSSIAQRFPIYLSYRQTGKWTQEIVGPHATLSDFSLSQKELRQLPPTFIAASDGDQDVPFHCSQDLARFIPENHFHQLTGLPHDFDSNTHLPEGKESYNLLIHWLQKRS